MFNKKIGNAKKRICRYRMVAYIVKSALVAFENRLSPGTFETINKWFMVLCIPCHVQTEIIEINNNNKKHNCIIETCFLYMFRVII